LPLKLEKDAKPLVHPNAVEKEEEDLMPVDQAAASVSMDEQFTLPMRPMPLENQLHGISLLSGPKSDTSFSIGNPFAAADAKNLRQSKMRSLPPSLSSPFDNFSDDRLSQSNLNFPSKSSRIRDHSESVPVANARNPECSSSTNMRKLDYDQETNSPKPSAPYLPFKPVSCHSHAPPPSKNCPQNRTSKF
jgi:hypothetical protein